MTGFEEIIASGAPVLTDGGIETRIMFDTGISMDPDVQVAALTADPEGREALRGIYAGYVDAAKQFDLPVIVGSPTFRASPAFIARAGMAPESIESLNADAVNLLKQVRRESGYEAVFIAGVIGPSGDAYLPEQALSKSDATEYHQPQAAALADAGVDFLFAPTYPSVTEAEGACVAMAGTGKPHVISYILGPDQRVLDGTSLAEATTRIDAAARPLYHSLSCIHPTAAARAIEVLRAESPEALRRLHEFKANGSQLRTDELIALDHPVTDGPATFAREMYELWEPDGLRILGGCCGTGSAHMVELGRLMADRR